LLLAALTLQAIRFLSSLSTIDHTAASIMAYWGSFQEHRFVSAFPFERVQNTSFGDSVMTLDVMDEVLGSTMDMGGYPPDEHTTLHVPAAPVGGEGLTGCQNGMAMLDTPAFQRTPQADLTPAAIAQSYLLSPETRNPGLGEVRIPKAPVFRSPSEASDISRNESHTNSMASPIQVRYATAQDWERYRTLFTRLYCDENMTLKDVKSIMKEKYGFNATYDSSIAVVFTEVDERP
jgi:hypothetical protein